MSNESNNNKRLKIALIAIAILASAAAGYYYWSLPYVSTDDAYVDGRIFTLTPRVAGYVTRLAVEDNQRVTKGEDLVFLDPTDYEVALAEAKANLAEAEYTLTSLKLGVPLELSQTEQKVLGAQAEIATLENNLAARRRDEDAAAQDLKRLMAEKDKAALDLRRMTELRKGHAISQSVLDETQTKMETATASVGAAEAKVEAVKKQIAALTSDKQRLLANVKLAQTGEEQAVIRSKQVEAQQARVDLAATKVKQAELNLEYTTIKSPTDGFVTRKKIEAGVMVARGQALFAVVPLDLSNTWVTANYKETQLSNVKVGQPVTIEVDTYDHTTLKGTVDSIMAGTGAAFSLFPPENATGNFVKVVQRIPVKITINGTEKGKLPQLRVGMSVIPTIDTRTAQ